MTSHSAQPSLTNEEAIVGAETHLWGQIAVQSPAKFWDTAEEDEAWAYLQEAT